MEIKRNVSLKPYNTFGLNTTAAMMVEVSTPEDVKAIVTNPELRDIPKLILGGGSNMLLTRDYEGLVIKNNIKGRALANIGTDEALFTVGSGEIWHEVVLSAISKGLGGIENLSLIPGTVGAAPIQNIGAYGVELQDTFVSLKAIDMQTGEEREFAFDECRFGYRDSIFKQEAKGRYFITEITMKLSRKPKLNLSYGAIQQTLQEMNIAEPDIAAVSKAVCHIRSTKLPDPRVLGNSGSFFKNPEIPVAQYSKLKEEHPNIPGYPVDDTLIKVPAGWLIEQCGWKGKRIGNVGSHKDQALVLVNYGGAQGSEIRKLAEDIQQSVKEKFGIELTPEVNIL